MQRTFLSTEEAAHYLNVSKDTLRNYAKTGKVKNAKPSGRKFYFRKEDLDKFVMGTVDQKEPLFNVMSATNEELAAFIDSLDPNDVPQQLFFAFKKIQEIQAEFDKQIDRIFGTLSQPIK